MERLMVALPASHPFRGRSALSLSDLRQERFVMVPWRKGHGFGRLIMRVCGRAGFVPTIEQEAEPMDSVLGLVSAGVGIALVPALYARLPVPRMVYKPLRERFAVADIALAWRTDDASPVRRAFVDIARRDAPHVRSQRKGTASGQRGAR
jgi:DNA-binding transcriptional LysR family regulator